jgi:hypothetical protein
VLDLFPPRYQGHQEGAVEGVNPHKSRRPSRADPTDFVAGLRLILDLEVLARSQTGATHGAPVRYRAYAWRLRGREAHSLENPALPSHTVPFFEQVQWRCLYFSCGSLFIHDVSGFRNGSAGWALPERAFRSGLRRSRQPPPKQITPCPAVTPSQTKELRFISKGFEIANILRLTNCAISEINADLKGHQYRQGGIGCRQHSGAAGFFGES